MSLSRITEFVLKSRVSAMTTAFVLTFIPVIGSLSIVIAALVTLRKGAVEGALIFVAASAPMILGHYTSPAPTATQSVIFTMYVALLAGNFFTWLLAVVLRYYCSWVAVLEFAALSAIVVIGMVHLFFPDIQAEWVAHLADYMKKMTVVTDANLEGKQPEQLLTLSMLQKYLVGIVVGSVLFNATLQLLLARWWQSAMFNPGGLRPELYHIRLSHVAGIVFLTALTFAYLGNAFALEILLVLFVVFCAAGLSLLHCFFANVKNGLVWLIVVYTAFGLMLPLSATLIAFVGLMDTAMNFRKRFKKA